MRLILYSKPGCHLCEGLQEKLDAIAKTQIPTLKLEVRDITSREDWFRAYEYEIPVIFLDAVDHEVMLPRPSPRATLTHLQQMIQKYMASYEAQ